MTYFYYISLGQATLNKGDDLPLKNIGKFKSDKDAKDACEKHFEKACKALANLGKPLPFKAYIWFQLIGSYGAYWVQSALF